MGCAFFTQGIEKRLPKLTATQSAFVNLKQKVIAVEAKADAKAKNEAFCEPHLKQVG